MVNGCAGAAPEAPRAPTTSNASADAEIELVESVPIETTLDHPDIPNAAEVWLSMIDNAKHSLDFGAFYASDIEGPERTTSRLTAIMTSIERAARRNVRVRFIVDAGFAAKYPESFARVVGSGADVRKLDESKRAGGVHHAKYIIADGTDTFIGSQNFDWRSLAHIQEMALRIRSPEIGATVLDIFETDWQLAVPATPSTARVHKHGIGAVKARSGERIELVASPKGWLPEEASWELPKLVALLDGATASIDLQVFGYQIKDRAGQPFTMLDQALRRAAARGVKVRLLVSEPTSKPGTDSRHDLDALAKVANVEIRVIAIPPWSGGELPFARIAHAKYLVVDAARAWVGSSNWEGDYFLSSRNVGVIVSDGGVPPRLSRYFEKTWQSKYEIPLASYPPPSP